MDAHHRAVLRLQATVAAVHQQVVSTGSDQHQQDCTHRCRCGSLQARDQIYSSPAHQADVAGLFMLRPHEAASCVGPAARWTVLTPPTWLMYPCGSSFFHRSNSQGTPSNRPFSNSSAFWSRRVDPCSRKDADTHALLTPWVLARACCRLVKMGRVCLCPAWHARSQDDCPSVLAGRVP